MISVTLPSIFPEAAERTLRNLRDASRTELQVILVSPFKPPLEDPKLNITWIEEPKGTGTGCNAGHARAGAVATGNFLTAWVDDHFYVDGWDVLALQEYEERERQFQHNQKRKKPFCLGLRHVWPRHVGTEFGVYYPYFPFLRRSYVKQVGWFDPAFRRGFADGDLAMRVWKAGGRCEWSSVGLVVTHPDDGRKEGAIYDQLDYELFVERWAVSGWRTEELRQFNMDVVPEDMVELVEGNTIYRPEQFRERALAAGWRP